MSAGDQAAIQTDLAELLAMLHRGGAWAYWWTAPGKASTWFEVGRRRPLPTGQQNIYFGVHPSTEIPKTKTDGRPAKPEGVRSRIDTIAAVNCLFGEFDAKDFEGGKPAALTHILRLPAKPTAIIDSGGGWHAYWIFRIPIPITDNSTSKRLCRLQARWVEFVGGDPGAKDLARVLRVPGTLNYKYDPPRPVEFHRLDWEILYDPDELELLLPADLPQPTRPSARHESGELEPGTVDYWLDRALGEYPDLRNEGGAWLAAQLRDNLHLSSSEIKAVNYPERTPQPAGKAAYTRIEWERTVDSILTRPARDPARSNGNGHRPAGEMLPGAGADLPEQSRPASEEKIHLTDLGNARRFAIQHEGKALYTMARGWMVWNGKKWEEDRTGGAMRLAKKTVNELHRDYERADAQRLAADRAIRTAQEQGDEAAITAALVARDKATELADDLLKFALKCQGRSRIEAVIALALSEPEIKALAEDFDNDPWLLNCQNGILDLRSGELGEHNPRALMSKVAGAPYQPGAACPTWLAFLNRIFNGDQELISFLQRAAGYSLSGHVGEQCLFFLYGTGANGKSTFTNALQDALGDYAMKTRAETLMVKRQDSIPEEIAQLAGVRFMLAAELGEGQQLNESLIKDLTGGDKLRGRKLYHDSFEFYPAAKPWLYGNHKPIIKSTDEGIWRRPKLIPFEVTIPESERDPNLSQKLRAELPGILAWAVAGCLEWQRAGLRPPAKVSAATAQYRAEQDLIASFLDECCIINSLATVTAGDLYKAYQGWARENGMEKQTLSNVKFSRQLTEKGFNVAKTADGKPDRSRTGHAYYSGLGLTEAGGEYIHRVKTPAAEPARE